MSPVKCIMSIMLQIYEDTLVSSVAMKARIMTHRNSSIVHSEFHFLISLVPLSGRIKIASGASKIAAKIRSRYKFLLPFLTICFMINVRPSQTLHRKWNIKSENDESLLESIQYSRLHFCNQNVCRSVFRIEWLPRTNSKLAFFPNLFWVSAQRF